MYRKSAAPVLTRTCLEGILASLNGTPPMAAIFASCRVHLYTNEHSPSSDDVVADYTEATFDAYDEVTIAALTGPVNGTPNGLALIGTATWIAGDIEAPGQTCRGYYVTNADSSALFLAEQFATPTPFSVPGDFLNLDLIMNFPLILENAM